MISDSTKSAPAIALWSLGPLFAMYQVLPS